MNSTITNEETAFKIETAKGFYILWAKDSAEVKEKLKQYTKEEILHIRGV